MTYNYDMVLLLSDLLLLPVLAFSAVCEGIWAPDSSCTGWCICAELACTGGLSFF